MVLQKRKILASSTEIEQFSQSNDEENVNSYSENSNIITAVRVRPMSSLEHSRKNLIVASIRGNELYVGNPAYYNAEKQEFTLERKFSFDYMFWSSTKENPNYADQRKVYDTVGKSIVDYCFKGLNCSLFAYGQTGSGKTYTLMGHGDSQEVDDWGIIPRICKGILLKINSKGMSQSKLKITTSTLMEVSFYEIYNEKVRDLLSATPEQYTRIREHPTEGAYIENLTRRTVNTYDDVATFLLEGQRKRHVASTLMNSESSRSHAIFIIYLKQIIPLNGTRGTIDRVSKVCLIDLAGSERASHSGATGERLIEANNINKSLSTLGDVIKALSEREKVGKTKTSKKDFIPYRNSILTWLLKDSLGGNSRTIMLATISPTDSAFNETMNTLRYISRTKFISTTAVVNEKVSPGTFTKQLKSTIIELRDELEESEARHREREQLLQQKIANLLYYTVENNQGRKLVFDDVDQSIRTESDDDATSPSTSSLSSSSLLLHSGSDSSFQSITSNALSVSNQQLSSSEGSKVTTSSSTSTTTATGSYVSYESDGNRRLRRRTCIPRYQTYSNSTREELSDRGAEDEMRQLTPKSNPFFPLETLPTNLSFSSDDKEISPSKLNRNIVSVSQVMAIKTTSSTSSASNSSAKETPTVDNDAGSDLEQEMSSVTHFPAAAAANASESLSTDEVKTTPEINTIQQQASQSLALPVQRQQQVGQQVQDILSEILTERITKFLLTEACPGRNAVQTVVNCMTQVLSEKIESYLEETVLLKEQQQETDKISNLLSVLNYNFGKQCKKSRQRIKAANTPSQQQQPEKEKEIEQEAFWKEKYEAQSNTILAIMNKRSALIDVKKDRRPVSVTLIDDTAAVGNTSKTYLEVDENQLKLPLPPSLSSKDFDRGLHKKFEIYGKENYGNFSGDRDRDRASVNRCGFTIGKSNTPLEARKRRGLSRSVLRDISVASMTNSCNNIHTNGGNNLGFSDIVKVPEKDINDANSNTNNSLNGTSEQSEPAPVNPESDRRMMLLRQVLISTKIELAESRDRYQVMKTAYDRLENVVCDLKLDIAIAKAKLNEDIT